MNAKCRIWFQKHTVEGRRPLLDDTYRQHVSAVASKDTEVTFATLPSAAYETALPEGFVRYGAAEAMFSWYFAAQARTAAASGHDAYVIGTSQDPGLQEARALVDIPVLGYGETAFFTCASMGVRFGVVGFIPELEEPIAENIDRYGLQGWLSGFDYVDASPAVLDRALSGDPQDFLASFERACEAAVRRGAHIIVPGEGLPNEVLWSAGTHEIAGVPLLDADGLLVRAAEHALALRRLQVVPRPRQGYRFRSLPEAESRRLFELFKPQSIPGDDPARESGGDASVR